MKVERRNANHETYLSFWWLESRLMNKLYTVLFFARNAANTGWTPYMNSLPKLLVGTASGFSNLRGRDGLRADEYHRRALRESQTRRYGPSITTAHWKQKKIKSGNRFERLPSQKQSSKQTYSGLLMHKKALSNWTTTQVCWRYFHQNKIQKCSRGRQSTTTSNYMQSRHVRPAQLVH
jgi:hypothetical protein